MALTVKQTGGGDFELVPEGNYVARCYQVIDLGTQQEDYMGEVKFMSKVRITWELLDEPHMEDGRPFAISKEYTASLSEKSNLYKDLVSWRGKSFTPDELLGFDISKLLGAYCQLQVIHKTSKTSGREYAIVNNVVSTKERPDAVNKDAMFDIGNPDMDVFEDFSDWLKDKIRASEEWKAKEIQGRGESDNKSINAADIDIDKGITIEDLGGEEDTIDPKDIPF